MNIIHELILKTNHQQKKSFILLLGGKIHNSQKVLQILYDALQIIQYNPFINVNVILENYCNYQVLDYDLYLKIHQIQPLLNTIEPVPTFTLDLEFNLFRNVIVGGTFDYLHSGHKILLTYASHLTSNKLVIGITDYSETQLASKKYSEYSQPFHIRSKNVKIFINLIKPELQVIIIPIRDKFGSSLIDVDLQCIVGSNETSKQCTLINNQRQQLGLNCLNIRLVDCLGGNFKVSSSHIRTFLKLNNPILH